MIECDGETGDGSPFAETDRQRQLLAFHPHVEVEVSEHLSVKKIAVRLEPMQNAQGRFRNIVVPVMREPLELLNQTERRIAHTGAHRLMRFLMSVNHGPLAVVVDFIYPALGARPKLAARF